MDRSSPFTFDTGDIIAGRYEVVRKLGDGGMATVYEVIDHSLEEHLALKYFSAALWNMSDDPTLLARFRNEATITRKLTHPNIVRTFEFGEDGDAGWFMTMELIEGSTLEQLIEKNAFQQHNFSEMLAILAQIADAIDCAHRMGIVHRDLKPANVLISRDGQVKITDFGLALLVTGTQRLTQTGMSVGTPMYMSPEQIQGVAVDHRTDIFSLGLIAYELVVGKPAFSHPSWYDLASQIVTEPTPRAISQVIDVPPWYELLISRATAKRCEDRFQSGAEIRALLEKQAPATTTVIAPLSPDLLAELKSVKIQHTRHDWRLAMVSIASLVFIVIGIGTAWRWTAERSEAQARTVRDAGSVQLRSVEPKAPAKVVVRARGGEGNHLDDPKN